jgi:hypothetical protein
MEVDVSLWQARFGYPLGTVVWSAMIESRAHLDEQMAKTAADPGFLDLVGRGQEFTTDPPQDMLRSVVHMTREPAGAPPIGAWVEVISAAPAEGKMADAMAWGVEIAEHYTTVTGSGAAFLADDYGMFGQLTWISVHDDGAAADAAGEATATDAGYLAAVDGGAHLFLPGSATRTASTRIA